MRGTSRTGQGREQIEAAGIEGVVADPDRLGTVLAQLEGVSVALWLMGTAAGDPRAVSALHGPRLQAMLERLVDTPVRGLVYEAAGTVAPGLLAEGAALTRRAAATWHMPVAVVDAPPADADLWAAAMRAGVAEVLAA